MIKWEEFEHIHVIRKIREVVGNWFHVDIIFVDDQGQIKNFSRGEKKLWKNTLLAAVAHTDKGFEWMAQTATKAVTAFAGRELAKHEFECLPGFHAVAFPIVADGEYMGCILSLGFRHESEEKAPAAFVKMCEDFGLGKADADKAYHVTKQVKPSEMQYFFELNDIVAQEVVTLHKEITLREDRIKELHNELGQRHHYNNMIGKSKPMQQVFSLLEKIKATESTVLVQGENGTGKELIAKAIHYNSPRKDKTFLAINCAAFNDNLLESELFGHVRGAFTGAVKDRKGYFEAADNGTLFMDEIGDISQAMQVKLLRVLQDGTFTPVGANEGRKSHVRIIAATNRNLKEMVEKGDFRQDLYYRLNVISIVSPALRERKDDIPMLVDHFLEKSCKEKSLPVKQISKRALQKFFDYNWPGNIRELENETERCVVLSGDEVMITPEMLSPRILEATERNKVQGSRLPGKLKDAIEELERQMIKDGLRRTNWNKSQLAKELGISRAGLIMKVEKYGLDKRKTTREDGQLATGSDDE